MATDNPSISANNDFTVITYTYTGLDTADDGTPFRAPEYADKTVHVTGTQGGSAGYAIEGSNLPAPSADADFFVCDDTAGAALSSLTANGGYTIAQNPLWVRPHVTGGDGTTDLTFTFTCRRPTGKRQ